MGGPGSGLATPWEVRREARGPPRAGGEGRRRRSRTMRGRAGRGARPGAGGTRGAGALDLDRLWAGAPRGSGTPRCMHAMQPRAGGCGQGAIDPGIRSPGLLRPPLGPRGLPPTTFPSRPEAWPALHCWTIQAPAPPTQPTPTFARSSPLCLHLPSLPVSCTPLSLPSFPSPPGASSRDPTPP